MLLQILLNIHFIFDEVQCLLYIFDVKVIQLLQVSIPDFIFLVKPLLFSKSQIGSPNLRVDILH